MRRLPRTTVLLAFIVIVLAARVFASSPADYKRRLNVGVVIAHELIEIAANGDKVFESEKVSELRRLIPQSEKIDLPDGSIETDNKWLGSSLDEFAKEKDAAKRESMLAAITERLTSISESVSELNAAAAAERAKDEDKQKLAEILRRAEYQKPEPKGESLFQKWWREFLEWLSREFPRPAPSSSSGSSFDILKLGLQVLIFAAIIALIGFLIWRFAPFISGRFRNRYKKDTSDRVILGERIGADASAFDLFNEAEMLAQNGDHRGAIRKGYIALLCELGDRNILRLARHKTNRDYLRDVQKRDEFFADMTGLTGNFERSWYGLRLAGADDWADFRDRCRRAVTLVKGD